MRIAIVQAGLGAGGTERVVSLLAADRCRRGDEVHLFAFVDEESYFVLDPAVTIHRLPDRGGTGWLTSLRRIASLRAEFRRLKPDLVVSFLTKINLLCLLATIGLGVRVVISERNNPTVQKKHILWRLVSAAVLPRADRLVMQTDAIANTLPPALKKKAVVIGNPCDRSTGVGTAADAFRLVAVGRLVEQKGFDTLIDGFARVAERFPDWTLTIFGEGPDRGLLERQVDALDLKGRVMLPGVTARAGEWVGVASVFVLTSRYEGFPNVLIEAMAAGLPVISTDCDFGPAEIVAPGISGLLVPVDDVAELAAALSQLMADAGLRCKLGEAAHATAARFSQQAIMDKWDAAFTHAWARPHGWAASEKISA
jgi:glycosyltransferase involved in cell wall biosynthesis